MSLLIVLKLGEKFTTQVILLITPPTGTQLTAGVTMLLEIISLKDLKSLLGLFGLLPPDLDL